VAAALLRLNLQGPLALARAALPHMAAARRGRHVVVASMSGGWLFAWTGLLLLISSKL
jgi:NAD(P)-dependent dehydrogenase (short-subunit alcohol dehydrogenase family)